MNKNNLQKKLKTWPEIETRSLAYQSGTLTITLECFLCLCEAVIECYSSMGDSVSHSNHYTRMFSVLV